VNGQNRHDFSAPQSLIVLIALIAPSIAGGSLNAELE